MNELFQNWLMRFALGGGCACASLLVVVAARRQLGEAQRMMRRLPPWQRAAMACLLAVCLAYGGTKTNQVDRVGLGLRSRSTMEDNILCATTTSDYDYHPPVVTPEDIARGWQVWEVRTNAAVDYAMPEGTVLASNWWMRGAYEDVVRIGSGDQGTGIREWLFTFGTNEYSSLWAFSWGKARFALASTNAEIVAVGAPMSAVPYRSRLWSAADANGSRLVTWENFALNRDTNTPVNAQIELRPSGDFVTRSNEVETVCRRVDDFDWDGDGIPNWDDGDPYRHDGDHTGQADGWAEYVDETVGTGLENGYYKLTATFPQTGFRRTLLTVGWHEVVVAEPGEYVFLLEKGTDYEFDIEPFSPDVSFDVADDIPLGASPLMRQGTWHWWSNWTVDGGNLAFVVPSFIRPGFCRWMPTFHGSPDVPHLGPSVGALTFTAVLSDYRYAENVAYHWTCEDGNVMIASPNSRETQITFTTMPSWASATLSVTATVGTNELRSTLAGFTYGRNDTPQVHFGFSVPNAVLLNSNRADNAKLGKLSLSFSSDDDRRGSLRLSCVSGGDKIALWGTSDRTARVSCSRTWDVDGFSGFEAYVEGVETSGSLDDVQFRAEFIPDDGETEGIVRNLTVVEVGDVLLPGAPNDGLVVSTGTSVALDLDVLPTGADGLVSVVYKVRRLRGNGTYTDWEYATGSHHGTDAVYNPSSGGIYQVQAFAGLGWGAADERYYVWEDYSDYIYGIKVPGDVKAFGVCDEEWQKSVRNCARVYLGDTSYGYESTVGAFGGFSEVGSDSWKCNVFVAHRLTECNLPVPAVHHGRFGLKNWPPLANEWGSQLFEIDHWLIVETATSPQPGMVVVKPSAGPNGHMGIVDFDGMAISAQYDSVTRASNAASWGNAVYRRYTDD